MTQNGFGVALVGYGFAGKTFHAPLLAATPGLHLRMVVSQDPAKVRADWPDMQVVGDLAAALNEPRIDLVVIATPNALHAPQAHAALAGGKHVVIDKPFAATLDQARALVAHAQQTGRVLSVFHNRRWDGDFMTLRRLINAGVLGDIRHFESHFDRFRPELRSRWRERAEPGSGLWFDLGSHLLDQALQLFGRPRAIYADFAAHRQGSETTDYFHVQLRYPHQRAILHASALVADGALRFAVHGTSASLITHGLDSQEALLKAGLRPGSAGWRPTAEPGRLTPGGGSPLRVPIDAGDYVAYYSQLRDCLAGSAPNPIPPSQALETMELLALAAQSDAERRELSC
jgi:predicted dehydrogenase